MIKGIIDKLKNKLLYIVSKILGPFALRFGIVDRFVLVKMDGGLCSQMHFYLIGNLFKEKGYSVKYNVDWFNSNGYDMNGQFVRKFDLLKAFPDLEFNKSTRIENIIYRSYSYYNDYSNIKDPLQYLNIKPPVLLTGYYRDPVGLYMKIPFLFHCDNSILDIQNHEVLNEINSKCNPVAIHIRRGDLARYNPVYGNPVGSDYINHSINYIKKNVSNCYFFFFSDEPNWVRENLVPQLDISGNYCVVDINGSDKGYMDLILMASCHHHITSKGSLGKYAAFLNANNGIIIICDDQYERELWEGNHPNIVFVR